jgi:chromosome segregation ATPase
MKKCSERCLELETLLTVYQVREKDVEDKLVSSEARVAELECELNASKERIIAIEDRASHHEASAKEESIAQTLELERVLSLHQSQAHHATEAMLKLESRVRELEWELQTAAAELENHPEALEHQGQIAATHQVEEDKDNAIDVLEDVATKQNLELDIISVLHESQMKEVSARLTGLAARIVELEKELQSYVVKESKQAQRLEAVEEIIAQRDETVRQLGDNAMELQGLIAAHWSSSKEKSNCIALLQANVKKLEMEISSSQDQATLYEDRAKHLAERSLELEKLLSEHQHAAQNAAESAASLQDLLLVAHNTNAEMNADMTEMGRKLSLLEVQCCETEEKASQKVDQRTPFVLYSSNLVKTVYETQQV